MRWLSENINRLFSDKDISQGIESYGEERPDGKKSFQSKLNKHSIQMKPTDELNAESSVLPFLSVD